MASKMTNRMAHKLNAPEEEKKKKTPKKWENPRSTQDKQTHNSIVGNEYVI